jgi:transposase-like protein
MVATMTRLKRGRYTLQFKQETARPVESGQIHAADVRSLGVEEQTLANGAGNTELRLDGATSKSLVSAEKMDIIRLRAELVRNTMERDNLDKRRHSAGYESDRRSLGGRHASL